MKIVTYIIFFVAYKQKNRLYLDFLNKKYRIV